MYRLKRNGHIIASHIKPANDFVSRSIGLMFTKEMKGYDGLLLEPTISIHTCFMRFDIDVLFLNKKNEIIKIIYKMKPWRVSGLYFKASKVVELNAGTIPTDIKVGEQLDFECLS